MKRNYAFPVIIAGSLALAACGSDTAEEILPEKEVEAAETKSTETGNSGEKATAGTGGETSVKSRASDGTGQNEMRKKMESLDYTEFELEVEYTNDEEYEAQLELKSDGSVVAGYEDDMNGVKKEGIKAFNDLYPLVGQLELTPSSNQEEEIRKVLSAFSLPDDYTDFSLELRFSDGTKHEFEVEQ
ncbi:YusW family protein [Bhargavaea beijingensis]|uniref:YusW-like protein n=1 Tax=Bhargavaea beijingensis TaxID=426756 RepID=A0A1G6YRE2_9BACL|nr:YusW family protein [Bhargavaea beijingensis]MCW1928655.1 YusW family protein [Bhargavaea beijingensis]SDD92938.1 YusW-like protein [Bhargavaea beijingensis]